MTERPSEQPQPRRRGRPRKNPEQSASVGGETNQDAESTVVIPEAVPSSGNLVEAVTHRFIKAVYKDGTDVLGALSTAQDDLFTQFGLAESFQALHSMTTLGLEEARDRNNQELVQQLESRQRAFGSALKRVSPSASEIAQSRVSPSNPSSYPGVGRKG